MRILITTEAIHPGGAETFLLRLAESLHRRGHQVLIFNFHKRIYNKDLHQRTAPSVTVVSADIPAPPIVRIVEGFFRRMGIDSIITNHFIAKKLRFVVDEFEPDIIHSHLFKTDVLSCLIAKPKNIPVVTTQHGDYAMYYHGRQQKKNISLPGFMKKLRFVLNEMKEFVCISGEQEQFFENEMQSCAGKNLHFRKIYNGYERSATPANAVTRSSLNIPENSFVFGMVARGIREKGWEQLIQAFIRLNDPQTHLLLVGGSEYMEQLKTKYAGNTRIIFAGTVINPLDWISIFDAGVLPSYFGSESLPTVVMEYLYCQKPVIATKIGELPAMIEKGTAKAGVLVPLTSGIVDEEALFAALKLMKEDQQAYLNMKANTGECFQQFDMDSCTTAYENLFKAYVL